MDVGSQNAVATIHCSAPRGPVSLCPPIPGDKYTSQNATKSKSLTVPLKHCQRGSKSQPTDTHLVILFSPSSRSQYLSCPVLLQGFSAHPVIQPPSKFLQLFLTSLLSFLHLLYLKPLCLGPLPLVFFFSSMNLLGLPVSQVFPPLITPTCTIKFRNSLKMWEWEGPNGYK